VARFAIGELLANAAWAGVLTYSGALLLESYDISPGVTALCLGAMAVAMLPGTFIARRRAMSATPRLLAGLTAVQAAAVLAVGTVRPSAGVTVALLAAMAFVNGSRSMIASALGMDAAADDRIAVMSLRAAANQFGYLLGAATGGLALALGGFAALGVTFSALFLCTVAIHTPSFVASPLPAES
jgi:predicted MFS family arabinose efflux permease